MKRKNSDLKSWNQNSDNLGINVENLIEKLPFITPIKKVKPVKHETVDKYQKLCEQLQGIYDELAILSKKSPNEAVNTFKLKFINKLLQDSNDFLNSKYRPFDDFSQFDLDEIPQNSDVVLMLSQYLHSFEKFRADSIIRKHVRWYWVIEAEKGQKGDEQGLIYSETTSPKRLRG